ncbi:MAG: hypothetical protein QGG89_17600, partial [Vicinamibacterales bacterium]|nr:hypothetical protein [Vicinamibacterales bacterium]
MLWRDLAGGDRVSLHEVSALVDTPRRVRVIRYEISAPIDALCRVGVILEPLAALGDALRDLRVILSEVGVLGQGRQNMRMLAQEVFVVGEALGHLGVTAEPGGVGQVVHAVPSLEQLKLPARLDATCKLTPHVGHFVLADAKVTVLVGAVEAPACPGSLGDRLGLPDTDESVIVA